MIHLVDASVFVFRAWFSIPDRMSDAQGRPVNAVYGYTGFLLDLLQRTRPSHMAVAFDESLTTSFRNEIFPPYKANRELPPAELERQFGFCREITGALGIRHFAHERFEADDIIGTLAWRCRAEAVPSAIVSRDKDLAQLLREGDLFLNPVDDVSYRYGDIAGKFGALPERLADYQALVGDKVDNIAGVPGVGAKTAAALMAKYESLESLFDNLDEVETLPIRGAASVARRLRENREAAFLARELTRIVTDMPMTVSAEDLRRQRPDEQAVAGLFDRLDFGPRLRRQLAGLAAGQ